jgi:hypothetical protein
MNSEKTSCLLVQDILFSLVLSKSTRIKIHRTLILPIVLSGCNSLIMTENIDLGEGGRRRLEKIAQGAS